MKEDSTASDTALRSELAADPLWDFALAFYSRPGVESACLLLQDEAGIDVCELLWLCWLYRHGVWPAHEPEGLAAVRDWQQEVTQPLRSLRRRLKAAAIEEPGVAEVRQSIKRAELAAERETLRRLQRLAQRSQDLVSLPVCASSLEISLTSRWKLQKKEQLLAAKTLECQLDPLWGAR